MTSLADFPNLTAPIWKQVRVPVRESAERIGERMSMAAGFDPEDVRRFNAFYGKGTPDGLIELRCRIAFAMRTARIHEHQISRWFEGFSILTVRRYIEVGRNMEDASC